VLQATPLGIGVTIEVDALLSRCDRDHERGPRTSDVIERYHLQRWPSSACGHCHSSSGRTGQQTTAIELLLRSRSLRRARAVLGYHNDTYDYQIERHPAPRQHGIRDVDASQVREWPWYSQVLVRLILGKSRIRSRKCQERRSASCIICK
jgi:hypothetical protein